MSSQPTAEQTAEALKNTRQHIINAANATTEASRTTALNALEEVPELLKKLPNWVVWRLEGANGKMTKVPYVSGSNWTRHASSTDPATWTDFQTAANGALSHSQGVGFVINGAAVEQQLVGFDLDGCRDAKTGELKPWAHKLINLLDSYTEITPSKTGVRVWAQGALPAGKRVFNLSPEHGYGDKVKIEVYEEARYFTVTGEVLEPFSFTPIQPRDLTKAYEACRSIQEEYCGEKQTQTGQVEFHARPGVQIEGTGTVLTSKRELLMRGTIVSDKPFIVEDGFGNSLEYPSHSEADLALCTALAQEGLDADQIDEQFRESVLCGPDRIAKWDRLSEKTIAKALQTAERIKADEAQTNPDKFFSITPENEMEEPLGSAESIQDRNDRDDSSPIPPDCNMTKEAAEAEFDKQYPVFLLKKKPGPVWSDDIFYGPAGEVIKIASEYNEAHPSGMLLDFLAMMGIIFGRHAYFHINSTRHYTNESVVRVGDSSISRKGGGRDAIDEIGTIIDANFYSKCVQSGFGSPEAIINKIKDASEQQRLDRKKNTFITTQVPGVKDKRLMIRESEMASVFVLANKPESRTDVILRDAWDGKPLRNVVKGNTEGINNSATCLEPHIGISGDTTRHELVAKMPKGADENGYGNRHIFCYVYRTKMTPLGGPKIDWTGKHGELIQQLFEAVLFAQTQGYMGLTAPAEKAWARMYLKMESEPLPGLAGKMTSRGPAHVRRLALIYALLDMCHHVEPRHLHAAKKLWDYCSESALFIFNSYTRDQLELLDFIERKHTTDLKAIRIELYQKHKRDSWIGEQVNQLIRHQFVKKEGDLITFLKKE